MGNRDDENPTGNIRRVGRKDRKQSLDKPASLFPFETDSEAGGDTRPTGGLIDDTQVSMPELPTEPLSLDFDADLPELAELAEAVFASDTIIDEKPPTPSSPPPISKPAIDTSERYPPLSFAPLVDAHTPPVPQPPPISTPIPTQKRGRRYGKWYHDLIAIGFMIGTIGLMVVFVTIWRDPWSPLNPLPPATTFIEVTWTPDMTALAIYFADQTATAQAENAPMAINTPANSIINPQNAQPAIVQPMTTLTGDKPFTISEAGVLYTPNSNGRGCNWSSIGGTVTDRTGQPLNGYAIQIIDIEEPTRLNVVVTSGSSLNFGAGGFELALGSTPRNRSYRIQLFDSANNAVSEPFQIFTREACDQNVAVVNFIQTR
jgi:hypothetical protein